MKTILAFGAAMAAVAGAAATPAAGQRAPRIAYATVTETAPTTVVVTNQWQAPPPPPAPQYDPYIDYAPIPVDAEVFAGFRAEAQVGFDRLRDEADGFVFFQDGGGRNGVSYGGEVGFDAAVGPSLLLGGYVGLEGSSIEQCDSFPGSVQCVRANRSFAAGGRIGFALSPFAMLYGKGGYTNARIRTEVDNVLLPGGGFRLTDDLDGFHVGGGLETTFGRNAYGKIEYVYTRLRGFPLGTIDGVDAQLDFDRHQIRAGLGLRL